MRDMLKAALIHLVGGVNWLVFRISKGHVVLYRFGGMPGLSIMISGPQASEHSTLLLPYLADGNDFVLLGNCEAGNSPEWATELLGAGSNNVITVEIYGQDFDVTATKINREDSVDLLWRLLVAVSFVQYHEVKRRRLVPCVRLVRSSLSVE
ncbi:hypothetical protein [Streptosporangium sp. NPDC006007]|uniref:hypothetical protein n=1 Tax=Streptosporangium sp. NPDC006007 TaxID=3154575 RepID=UPI0033BD154E